MKIMRLDGLLCRVRRLWGVSCIQTWYYFRRYPKDFWYVKLLVRLLSKTMLHFLLTFMKLGGSHHDSRHHPPDIDNAYK
jgi:hypothetical protein